MLTKSNDGMCKWIQQITVKCTLVFPFQKKYPARIGGAELTHQYLKTSSCVSVKLWNLFLCCSGIKLIRTVEYIPAYPGFIGPLSARNTVSKNMNITNKYLRWDKKCVCKRERSHIPWGDVSQICDGSSGNSFFLKIPLAVNGADALSVSGITAILMKVDCQAHKCWQLLSGWCCQASSSFNM